MNGVEKSLATEMNMPKIIFLDVDGTLLDDEKRVSEAVKEKSCKSPRYGDIDCISYRKDAGSNREDRKGSFGTPALKPAMREPTSFLVRNAFMQRFCL